MWAFPQRPHSGFGIEIVKWVRICDITLKHCEGLSRIWVTVEPECAMRYGGDRATLKRYRAGTCMGAILALREFLGTGIIREESRLGMLDEGNAWD